jgi:hypothetical protein
MSLSSFIGDHTMLIGVGMVGGFVIWKFILQPVMNEGQPIEPTEEDIKTFGEKMQENLNTSVDF